MLCIIVWRKYSVSNSSTVDGLAVLFFFYSKTGFWPSYCQISTDMDKILHTPIFVRNTRVGRLRLRSTHAISSVNFYAKPLSVSSRKYSGESAS